MTTIKALSTFVFLIVMCEALSALGVSACATIFPRCDDPQHPCPNVEPDYPIPVPFGATRDAAVDAHDPGSRM